MASEKRSVFHTFFLLFLLSFFLLFLDKFDYFSWFKGFAANFANPAKESIYFIYQKVTSLDSPSWCTPGFRTSGDECGIVLEEKLKQFEIEVQDLKVKVGELKQENQSMRQLLEAPLPASWQFLPAKIIGYKQGELFLNRGKKDDIMEGQVIVFGQAYVGQILRAEDRNAWARTLYHREAELSVRVSGTNIVGKLKNLNGQTIVDEVERDKKLNVGSILVTRGEKKIPAGITVGEIKRIVDDPITPFQKAQVEPAVDPRELVDVFVITE